MKSKILFIALFVITFKSFSQENINSKENTQNVFFANKAIYTYSTNNFIVRYVDGKVEVSNTMGSPFLFKQLLPGRFLLNDKNLNFPQINYDAFQDHFVIFSKEAMKSSPDHLPFFQLDNKAVRVVNLLEKGKTRTFVHINPDKFAGKPATQFMEIFTTQPDKAYILASYKKIHTKTHRKAEYMLETWDKKYKFKLKTEYYVLKPNGYYVKIKLGKSNILKKLDDAQHIQELKKYIKKHKLNLRKPKDVQEFFAYYYEEVLNKK